MHNIVGSRWGLVRDWLMLLKFRAVWRNTRHWFFCFGFFSTDFPNNMGNRVKMIMHPEWNKNPDIVIKYLYALKV